MNELTAFRAEIDDFMGYHPQSPLDDEQKAFFTGLNYYPDNEALVLEVEVTLFSADEPLIEMQTNTGETRLHRRWGKFVFSVEGVEATLVIYSDAHGQELFMPFKDATNGTETYGAGRYMDNHRPGIRHLDGRRYEIDLNYAYNPFCAYSPYYSCPLPPRENWLKVPIRAGEKDFA